MRELIIDNYTISEPIENILYKIKSLTYNTKLKDIKIGTKDILVTCPAHSDGMEKHPGCNIYIGEDTKIPYGYSRCFVCEFSGRFEKFVASCLNISIDKAKEWLILNYGVKSASSIAMDSFISINKESQKSLTVSDLDKYQKWTPYLAKRNISKEVCNKFNIRYDPVSRQIIFPVYDINNNLKMYVKRSIDTKTFYIDKNKDKEVYGLNIIAQNNINKCMLVEGPIDLLTCYTHGIYAIATLGNISDYQIAQINKSCLNNICIATDNDITGNYFANLLDTKLAPRIFRTRVKLPTNKKDVNDLSEEEWKKIISIYFE